MSIYRFNDQSMIDEITFVKTDGGGARAYLHAREGSDPATLEKVKRRIEKEDWQWTPLFKDGKAYLEVRGYGRKKEDMITMLRTEGAVQNGYKIQSSVDDVVSTKAKLKKHTLQASGISYFVGDANFMLYGWKEWKSGKSSSQDFVGGIFYSIGSWFIALFGSGDKSDMHLRDIARDTLKKFPDKEMGVRKNSALHSAAESYNDSFLKKVKDFCEKFPAELTNGSFGLAGLMIIWASIDKLKRFNPDHKIGHDRTAIKMDIGLGTMTTLAGLISVFVKEETPDPNEPQKTGLRHLWQKIKERPLSIAGGALGISTLCHAGSTIKDYRNAGKHLETHKNTGSWLTKEELEEAKKLRGGLVNRGIFVGANLLAEFLMSISSKGHGAGVKTDVSLDTSVHAVMADLVMRQPEEKREETILKLAKFISQKDHLACKPEEAEKGIREQLEGNTSNPWNALAIAPKEPSVPVTQKNAPSVKWTKRLENETPAPTMQAAMA